MKILIGIVVFIIWIFVSIQWYVCGIKELCKEKTSLNEPIATGNLLFYASGDEPLVNEQTYSLRDSLVSELQLNPNAKLQITGQFYSEEENHTNYSNLGTARANKVQTLLFNDIDSALIVITGTSFKPDKLNDQTLFRAVEFVLLKETLIPEFKFDKLTIYFPFAESKADLPVSLADSLKTLVDNLAKTNSLIIIEGHTDDIGSLGRNLNLGRARAEWIRDLLVSYGADIDKIELKSEGEGKPIENNSTATGRSKNRRVEMSTKPLN